ncbi:hypothetical protein MYMA111404_02230 [Mycoplasma marinum]|uniref:NADH:flavin oxidoreductase/NADH oxidase N-terminal domain-containing protein n=1 Tax=Mycoplasma marinum TaxID=1937190 RepID=A0A4V2NI34_9MOLU|nr:hypothetical protein [Mycoplasma marinum]TCG11338.1 hypothetical protein C4B24_02185 [Mycoplasma marinum]
MNKWNKKTFLKTLELKNKVVMAPMSTYESKNGEPNSFHIQHYSSRGWGNVGLIIQESTGVSEKGGRINDKSLGIFNDEQSKLYIPLVEAVHDTGAKIFIQLSHAGPRNEIKGETWSSSEIKVSDRYETALEMSQEHIQEVVKDFVNAAKRAERAGYDGIEIHAAHGYLLNSFVSPTVNVRKDEYGEDRFLIIKEIFNSIKNAGVRIPLGIRVSATEWAINKPNSKISDFVNGLKEIEYLIEYIHVSTGGVVDEVDIKYGPLFQLPFALEFKKAFPGTPIIGVGEINSNDDLNEVVSKVDLAAIGKALLKNPLLLLEWQEDFKDSLTPRVYQVMFGGKSPWEK